MNRVYLRNFLAAASLLAMLATVTPAEGGTIVETSGPNDQSTATTTLGNNLLVSFSTAVDYTNVSIEVSLISFFGGGDWNLTAYLTNQVGPGATVANEIASSFTLISIPGSALAPPYTITPYTVFSGLDLAAGDYHVMLSGTFETNTAWWVGSSDAVMTEIENGGAMVITHGAMAGAPDVYLPASTFSGMEDSNLWFRVTGDPTTTSDVPEPSSLALLVIGAMALAGINRRRARSV